MPARSPAVPSSGLEDASAHGRQAAGLPRLWHRARTGMKDTGRRTIYLAAMAIPGHLLMAGSKTLVLLFSFSAFMTANILFTFGLAVIKVLVVAADRRAVRRGITTAIPRAYRTTGLLVLILSIAYVVSCLPLALGHNTSDRYDENVAIAIAAIAFTELGFSVHGLLASRRNDDVLMEAIKLSNLASSLVLIVLAQTALLSMSAATTEDPSRYNGVCGVALGTLAALIGAYMLTRSRTHLARSIPEVADPPALGGDRRADDRRAR